MSILYLNLKIVTRPSMEFTKIVRRRRPTEGRSLRQRRKNFAEGKILHAEGVLLQLGVWGALLAPQWVQGRVLVGVQGAKPPKAQPFPVLKDLTFAENLTFLSVLLKCKVCYFPP